MSDASSPPNPAISPPACRWKKARPVYTRYGSDRSAYTTAVSQGLQQSAALLKDGSEQQPQASTTLLPVNKAGRADTRLWNTSHGIRFSSAPPSVPVSPTLSTENKSNSPTLLRHVGSDVDLIVSDSCRPGKGNNAETQSEQDQIASANDVLPDARSSQRKDSLAQSSDSEYTPSQSEEDMAMKENSKELEQQGTEDKEKNEEEEEHISLTYQIPDDLLRAAMTASPNTRSSFYNTKLYRGPEDETLSRHYCKTVEVAERVAQYFVNEKVIGFDIEWKPLSSSKSIKQNASLIQIACEDRIALFHIALFEGTTAEELLPPTVRQILESPDIIKVGVAVKGDFSRLQKYLGIQAQGVFELSRLHNLVEWYAADPSKVTKKLVGLAAQVLQHLQLPLYKGGALQDDPTETTNVRESDWSKPLDYEQIEYAAADAYAGFRLYHMLEWKRKQLRPTPPTPQLCDYDSKPTPRAKAAPKKPKSSKAKDATQVDGANEKLAEKVDQESVNGEGEETEGYETAIEDLMDSHELEDPVSSEEGQPTSARRVGRLSLSFLHGPDPAYPKLPLDSEEDDTSETLSQTSMSPEVTQDLGVVVDSANIRLPKLDEAVEEDEFPDPELEEALSFLDIDEDGKLLKNDSVPTAGTSRVVADHRSPAVAATTGLGAESTPSVETVDPPSPATLSPTISDPPSTPQDTTHTPEYDLATSWAQTYLQSTIPSPRSTSPSRIRATVPHLRAYHLWHEQKLSLDHVATHLRDPPLSLSTVANYILQAVTLEKLNYDSGKLKDVLAKTPPALRKWRYKWIAEKVGGVS